MSNFVPEGWLLSEAEELYSRMRVPQVYDRNLVNQSGKYPVLDQSENGCVGYLNSKPEFECNPSSPLTTFANHTCAVRQMTRSFGVIQNVFPLKAKAHVSQEFLFQILKGAIPQNGYKGHYPDLREKLFLTPPLPEQQKIATILSSVDDVIEKTRAQIDKLKDLKTGMMQELLTKGIGHTEFKDSPVGRIPESWEVFTMQEVLHAVIDYRGKSPPKSESGVPLITAKNIRQGHIDEEPREYIYEDQYDSWMVRGFPAKGDVFITTEAPLGNVARVPSYKFAIGQRVLTLSPKEFITTDYLFYMMQSRYFREQLDLESTGSTVAGIKQSTFRNILIPIPPKAEQVKIAGPLNAINRRTDTVSLKLDEMVSLKKALMQDLLTGKVRVKLTDKESAVV